MTLPSKTDTFFVISNYNTDPEKYLQYCNDYHIYDQSPDPKIKAALKNKYTKISFVQNTGHNISDYFRFFIDHYDNLPEWMMLAKGNMIGRHITQGFFERVYANKCYTLLYDDRAWEDRHGIAYQLYDGAFLEVNNSWYMPTKEYRYFASYNDLLKFLFKDPIFAEWVLFAPGACYVVSREQIRKYPRIFYKHLMRLVSYNYFPSEAYIVERMLHIIFSGAYELNDHVLDAEQFKQRLELARLSVEVGKQPNTLIKKIKNTPQILKRRLRNKCLKMANWLN